MELTRQEEEKGLGIMRVKQQRKMTCSINPLTGDVLQQTQMNAYMIPMSYRDPLLLSTLMSKCLKILNNTKEEIEKSAKARDLP